MWAVRGWFESTKSQASGFLKWAFKNSYLFSFYVCLSIHIYVHCIHAGSCGSQKRASNSLRMELLAVVSYHVGAEYLIQVPYKMSELF